jgi:hypothetical protein
MATSESAQGDLNHTATKKRAPNQLRQGQRASAFRPPACPAGYRTAASTRRDATAAPNATPRKSGERHARNTRPHFRDQISVPFLVPPYTTVPKTGPKTGPVFRTAFLRSQRRKRRTPRSQDDATGYQKRCPRPRLWAPPLGAPSGNCISAAKPLNAAQSKPTRQRARC